MAFERFRRMLGRKKELPKGLWQKCPDCGRMIFLKELEEGHWVCPECAHHLPLEPEQRISLLLDPGSFTELWPDLAPSDPLQFEGTTSYRKKIKAAQEETGRPDACIGGTGTIEKRPVVFGMTDWRFMMGSMGSVVGEKVTRCFEHATQHRLPVVFVSGSGGGARMYEGSLSLMQMAKSSAAIGRFSAKGGLFISILTHPTMGGVMASFASLGDITIAEPRALIGFAGPRVVEQTVKQKLPKGFQTSEFLLQHGFVDRVVARKELRSEVSRLLEYLT